MDKHRFLNIGRECREQLHWQRLSPPTFKPYAKQQAIAKEIAADYAWLITYLQENREQIAQARKKNGIEGKY